MTSWILFIGAAAWVWIELIGYVLHHQTEEYRDDEDL